MIDIFNEKKHAEEMIRRGFIIKKRRQYELKVLAKYYKFFKEYKPSKIKEQLIEFCQKYYEDFDIDRDENFKLINKTVRYLNTKTAIMRMIDSIDISEEFVQYFNELDLCYEHKKILFVLAAWSKINILLGYNKQYIRSYNRFLDLKKACGFKNEFKISKAIHELYKDGYFEICDNGNIKLMYLDNCYQGENIYKICELNEPGLWYDFYNGNAIKCLDCGKLIYKSSNAKKYCKECFTIKRKRESLEYWNKNKKLGK